MEKIYCRDQEGIRQAALEIIAFGKGEKIWIFKGDLGVGKTTLIKEIAQVFGIVDRVSSPTFSLINEYQNEKGEMFYHFDFYRIDDPDEVLEIGIEDYFYSNNYCWIEWAEKIAAYIPRDFILIQIEVDENQGRVITLKEVINGGANG